MKNWNDSDYILRPLGIKPEIKTKDPGVGKEETHYLIWHVSQRRKIIEIRKYFELNDNEKQGL